MWCRDTHTHARARKIFRIQNQTPSLSCARNNCALDWILLKKVLYNSAAATTAWRSWQSWWRENRLISDGNNEWHWMECVLHIGISRRETFNWFRIVSSGSGRWIQSEDYNKSEWLAVECRIDKSTWKQLHSVHVIKFSRETYNVVAESFQCLWDANHSVIVCACLWMSRGNRWVHRYWYNTPVPADKINSTTKWSAHNVTERTSCQSPAITTS